MKSSPFTSPRNAGLRLLHLAETNPNHPATPDSFRRGARLYLQLNTAPTIEQAKELLLYLLPENPTKPYLAALALEIGIQ